MMKPLGDDVIKTTLLSVGFLVAYCENLTEEELVWWRAVALAAQRYTLKQVVEWSDEVCQHMRFTHKGECNHCWKEFKQDLKKQVEEL